MEEEMINAMLRLEFKKAFGLREPMTCAYVHEDIAYVVWKNDVLDEMAYLNTALVVMANFPDINQVHSHEYILTRQMVEKCVRVCNNPESMFKALYNELKSVA